VNVALIYLSLRPCMRLDACRGRSTSRIYIHSAYTHTHDSVSPSITRLERACSSEYRTHPRIDIARLSPISPSRAHHAHDHLDVPLLARLARALDHGGASHSAGRAIDSTLSKHPVALRHLSPPLIRNLIRHSRVLGRRKPARLCEACRIDLGRVQRRGEAAERGDE